MWQRLVLVLAVLSVPGVCRAQEKLEHLLPAGSQLFWHYDGVDGHKADADKLAVMKLWKGETGDFLRGAWHYMEDMGKDALAKELGAEMAGAMFDEFGGMLKAVSHKGFSLGVELQSVDPFKMQMTLVFPNGAGKTKSPLSFMTTMSKLDKQAKVKTEKFGKREIHSLRAEMFYFSWWAEGKDAVWSVGTTSPADLVKTLDNQRDGLAAHPLYKEVASFKEFPVWMRGYLDLPSLINVASKNQPIVKQIADPIGLDSLKSITFFSGFDGPAERAVTFTNFVKGPKKGFAKLITGKNFSLKDLPPMPADLHGFSAATMDWQAGYEVTLDFIGTVVNLIPVGAPNVKQAIKDFETNNNVNIGAIFGSLEQLSVTYSASAEGPLGMGQVQLFKVRDDKKLETELAKILKVAEKEAMGMISLKEDKYHGAALHTLTVTAPTGENIQRMTYTIHKGWLALSRYPQPIKGFILRSKGELPVWKASLELTAKLKPFPTEFCSIHISDPRPATKLILSLLPAVLDLGQMALEKANIPNLPAKKFNINLVPNAYETAKHLFPNITITTVEGDTIRSETRSSVMMPF